MLIKSQGCVLLLKQESLVATKQSCLPAGAELSAAWVCLICLPFLSLEHHLSRFLNKCSPCLGFGNFEQKLCKGQAWQAAAGNGRAAVSMGRQREKGGGGDVHAVLDLKCWQLLCLACVHRAIDVSKAGAGGEQSLGQSGWRFGIGRDLGQGGGSREVEGYCVTEGGVGVMLLGVGEGRYWGWWWRSWDK